MEQNYNQLATLRAKLEDVAERDKILNTMIPMGTYPQLSALLPKVSGTIRRAKVLDAMIPLGNYDQLAILRAKLEDIADRDKVLDRMIPMGTYPQLSTLLPKVSGTIRRAKVLDAMIPLGNYDQLAILRAKLEDIADRDKVLDRMIPMGTYSQLSALLLKVSGTVRRAKVLDAITNLASEKPDQETLEATQYTKLPQPKELSNLPLKEFDVFIAHASEDKNFASPLAMSLRQKGIKVWYDDFILRLGDSLRREIDKGLTLSRYGIVILSHNFFAKHWPQKELDALIAKEIMGRKIVLPVWHEVEKADIITYSPILADIIAVKSSLGIETVSQKIIEAISSQ